MGENNALQKGGRKKKSSKNVIKLIRKSNELVEARYKFDIWETRVFTKMLTMVQRHDSDFQEYRIYLKEIVKDFQIENNKDAYDRLRAGGYKLMSKIIKTIRDTDEGLMELATPIVVGVKNPVDTKSEGAKFIDVSFHPEMRPFLLSLKSKFTIYDVRNILKLPSAYSIRIYELLKQYEKIGRRKFELQELKEIIGVIEEVDNNGKKSYKDNYPLFGNFKQRVLLKSQKDLKKLTDIQFSFEPKKTGRKITHIIFNIFPNRENDMKAEADLFNEVEAVAIVSPVEDVVEKEFYALVKKWVSRTIVDSWVATLPEAQIRIGINYTLRLIKSGKPIKNIPAYFQKMVRTSDLKDTIQEKKDKIIAKKVKAKEADLKLGKLKIKMQDLMRELHRKENALIEAIFLQFPDAESQMIAKARERIFSGYDVAKSVEENKTSPIFSAAIRTTIFETYPNRFTALHRHYHPEIAAVKQLIKSA
ncbi:MAG: replication initiation protein [Saprospiraceae bacterium]